MMNERLFTAKIHGVETLLRKIDCDKRSNEYKDSNCFIELDANEDSFHYSDKFHADLRPVKVVDMDDVVISGITPERFAGLLQSFTFALLKDTTQRTKDDYNLVLSQIVKQYDERKLSTPAEPATGGEGLCQLCGITGTKKHFESQFHLSNLHRLPKTGIKSPAHETTEITTTSLGVRELREQIAREIEANDDSPFPCGCIGNAANIARGNR